MCNRKYYNIGLYFYTAISLAVVAALNHANIGPLHFAVDSVGAQNHSLPFVDWNWELWKPATNSYQSRSLYLSERQSFGDHNSQTQTAALRNTQRELTILQNKQAQTENPPATQSDTQPFGEFIRLFLSDTILLVSHSREK